MWVYCVAAGSAVIIVLIALIVATIWQCYKKRNQRTPLDEESAVFM